MTSSSDLVVRSSAINISQLSPIDYTNDTTEEWRVNTLPTNLTVINGTLSNGTIINGKVYNGSEINGTTIIERVQPSTIGTVSIVSFIYMIMSLFVIIFMFVSSRKWIWVAMNWETYEYTKDIPKPTPGTINATEFHRRLQGYYQSAPPDTLKPSYPEIKSSNPNDDFTSQGLRDFRDLIRAKYKLDCEIWNNRNAHARNWHLVEEKIAQSKAATADMLQTTERWVASRERWPQEQWVQVMEIHKRIKQLEVTERNNPARYPTQN